MDVSSVGNNSSINGSLVEQTDVTKASAADETVLSELSFSIPMQYDEPLEPYLNLTVNVKDNMLILDEEVHVNDAPDPQETCPYSASTVNISERPDSKALEIVESVLTPQKLISYTAALVSGKDIKNDSLFSTWKQYKYRLLAPGFWGSGENGYLFSGSWEALVNIFRELWSKLIVLRI